jgi:CHAT domain-containing protein/tetratricopeptide (TPR) repeat protein
MNSVRHIFLIAAAAFVLTFSAASLALAQSRAADQLINRYNELYQAGRYAEAIPLAQQLLAIKEKALGPDHPDVAWVLAGLANLYDYQGRYGEAELLYKRALAIFEKALGPDDLNVARTLNNLAALYYHQARYVEAEPLYKRSLAIVEKKLGPDDPEFARTLNNLSALYKEQGRYAEAEPLSKRSLAIREKALGPDHPDVARTLQNLALLYWKQGRYAEAEPPYKRSLAIYEKALGPDHPEVALALNNLGALYKEQGRYAEAEPLYNRSLAIREKALGPNHPDVAQSLNNLAKLYDDQGRYAEAEPLYKRALAIFEKALGPDHPYVATPLNNLALLYKEQGRYGEALPLVRRTISNKTAETRSALPVLFGAQTAKLIAADEAIDDGLNVVQRASQTAAGEALNALALRFSAGNDRLAQLVRRDQDLAAEAANLDKAIIAAVSSEPSKRDAAAEQRIRDRIVAIAKERADLQTVFTREFPDYAALSNPQPLTVRDIQALLADDEALVVVYLDDKKSYVWAVTRSTADWKELAVSAAEVSKRVSALLTILKSHGVTPFDTQASFELYRQVFGPVEDMIAAKARWSLVVNGALTSLPPQLLITRDPAGKALKDVDWLLRTHAVTVLPSVASLRVLRGKSTVADAAKPLIGFANPVFDRDQQQLQNVRVAANVAAARGIRGAVADIAELRTALPPLPETADELRKVAASVHANQADVILGPDATETRVKQESLDQFRIVYFATHGLLAGDVADFAKLNAEPALVLSLPEHPTEFDDGLLTASEVAQLKLNADWVVLSACNTASAEKPGAEALSGLARAFFYAGARSLIVSNWEVNSDSAVTLMVGTFAALAADPKLSHAEALRKSMLAMIDQHPEQADPKYWAPFVVVGEPAKAAN